jgi:hypothetical protein
MDSNELLDKIRETRMTEIRLLKERIKTLRHDCPHC